MSACGRLLRKLRGGHAATEKEQARTDDLIDEAERTRRELTRITDRLSAHVDTLKTLTRAYAQQQQEDPGGG